MYALALGTGIVLPVQSIFGKSTRFSLSYITSDPDSHDSSLRDTLNLHGWYRLPVLSYTKFVDEDGLQLHQFPARRMLRALNATHGNKEYSTHTMVSWKAPNGGVAGSPGGVNARPHKPQHNRAAGHLGKRQYVYRTPFDLLIVHYVMSRYSN